MRYKIMREEYPSDSGVCDRGNPHVFRSAEFWSFGVLQAAGMQSVGYPSFTFLLMASRSTNIFGVWGFQFVYTGM